MHYSSKNRRLSCNEIEELLKANGYDIKKNYAKSSIKTTIRREIKNLCKAEIPIDNLNGNYYMVNNGIEFIDNERMYAMIDLLNRAPTFNEMHRYFTITYLAHNYNIDISCKYISSVLYSKYHECNLKNEAKIIPIIKEAILKEAKSGDRIVIMGARDNSLPIFCEEILEGI